MLRLVKLSFLALLLATAAVSGSAHAQDRPKVGVVEHLGSVIPKDLVFHDLDRNEVRIGDLMERPTILLLVYVRCPGICSPLMHEVASMVGKVDLEAGKDYDLITVSFDPREDAEDQNETVRAAKGGLLKELKEVHHREIPPESWHFLTGSEENIHRLTEAVGFYYQEDANGDYNHAAATIFLSKEGKIVRYLHGTELLADNVELALIDAMSGKARSFMQTVQKLCFAFDPESNAYVAQINRIILAVTGLFLLIFLSFLLLRRKKKPAMQEQQQSSETTA